MFRLNYNRNNLLMLCSTEYSRTRKLWLHVSALIFHTSYSAGRIHWPHHINKQTILRTHLHATVWFQHLQFEKCVVFTEASRRDAKLLFAENYLPVVEINSFFLFARLCERKVYLFLLCREVNDAAILSFRTQVSRDVRFLSHENTETVKKNKRKYSMRKSFVVVVIFRVQSKWERAVCWRRFVHVSHQKAMVTTAAEALHRYHIYSAVVRSPRCHSHFDLWDETTHTHTHTRSQIAETFTATSQIRSDDNGEFVAALAGHRFYCPFLNGLFFVKCIYLRNGARDIFQYYLYFLFLFVVVLIFPLFLFAGRSCSLVVEFSLVVRCFLPSNRKAD